MRLSYGAAAMSAIRELTIALIKAGMDPVEATILIARAGIEMAPTGDTRTPGARRQARYRERNETSQSVTEVTPPQTSQIVTKRNETSQSDAASLSKKERIEEEKEVRGPRKARASQLPDEWQPGQNAWQAAVERIGPDRAIAELKKFKNHAADKGRVSKSWDAAWRNWVDRALDYGGAMGTKGNSNGKRTIHDAANDLLAKVRALDEPAPGRIRDREGEGVVRLLPSR